MASNEELALRLQQGDKAAAALLWQQNKGWGFTVARRFRWLAERNRAADEDDLMQCAFLGMLEAARTYDANRGGFMLLMQWHVMRECQDLLGLRGRKRAENHSVSADAPLDGAEGRALADLLEDTSLPGMSGGIELEELQNTLQAAIALLPEQEQDVVRRLCLCEQSPQAVADSWGISYAHVQRIKRKAFDRLRRNYILRTQYGVDCYRHKGIKAFHSSGSSVVEDCILWMESHPAS